MKKGNFLFTSESVTEGHPDKLCDQVSDAILDEMFKQDNKSRVAVETLTTTGLVVVAGEVTTRADVDVQYVVRRVVRDIGYDKPEYGFDADQCAVLVAMHGQSPDISQGVTEGEGLHKEQGAGDQGSMFGYACNETPELMPLPINLAQQLTMRLAQARKTGEIKWLRPDGKSQVTVEYVDGKPKRAQTVVISTQHAPDVEYDEIRKTVIEQIIKPICGKWLDDKTIYHINPTGKFVIGGPPGDSGLTGRKIIVDTYGGYSLHGGGAFCITGNALVNTDKGLVSLEGLKEHIGEDVIVKTDISPTKAGEWFYNGEMETVKVITENGHELEGTKNQNIRAIDENGNYIWRRLDQLRSTDWIAIQKKNRLFGTGFDTTNFLFSHKQGTRRKNINTQQAGYDTFTFPSHLTEDYAYLLGLLVGDGNCMMDGGIAVCVCEEQQKENVQSLYKKLFGKEGKIFGHWAFFGGIELREYLKYLGLDKQRSWEKHAPKAVFSSPHNTAALFLRGLFDTDGTARTTGRNNRSLDIKLSSTSHDLIKEIQQLLLSFGIISSIQTVDTTGKVGKIRGREIISKRPLYHLCIKDSESIRLFKEKIGFGLSRKQEILNSIDLSDKRNLLSVPNQRERIKRLWNKLPSKEKQKDTCKIGRLSRSTKGKATKKLTYEKLKEFLDTYAKFFEGDKDFEYLRTLFIMNHYYTKPKQIEKSIASVFDITVPGAHTFTANGFVCHNSGKDPSKVDRSAAYMARYIAKNVVAAGLADACEVQLAYAIGVAEPVSIYVETFGTAKISEEKILELVRKHFKMTPRGIIDSLNLLRPIYRKTASYGHFGRNDPDFTWEKTDKADVLKRDAGL